MNHILFSSLRKIAVFSLLAVFTFGILQAQAPAKYKKGKVKCTRAWITDPGELYSTYEFSEEELSLLKSGNKKITNALVDDIVENHLEEAWPGNLQNLDNRIDNPDILMAYVVYKVAKVDDKYILVIPAAYNKDRESGWIPAHDIYFVIGETGVSEKQP